MKRLVLRTLLPALLAIGLFTGVVFFSFIPTLNRAVMDQKRLMIRELTESSWNILARFEAEESAGRLSREEAQAAAVEQVRSLHYGQEGKDYFWINDMTPRMIAHPYRPDLEGEDLSAFGDPHGKLMFVEMADVVRSDGAGYVSYMWQWKDDPDRVVPKLSYVKGFAPWGWIIGTGVYTDDVDDEVASVTSRLQTAALLILGAVSLLMFLLLRTSFQSERGRLRVTAALRGSEEKYRSLVESAGESIFMSIGGEALYANASMLRLSGYEEDTFKSLDVDALLRPTAAERESGHRSWKTVMDGVGAPTRYEAELIHRNGSTIRIMVTLSRIVLQGRVGFMAVVSRLAQPRELDLMTTHSVEDLAGANRRMATMAGLMMGHDADVLQVVRMLSLNADAAVRKGVELAVQELGEPPVPYDIMLMGSLGRAEVTLMADQDHAIIYPDPEEGQDDVQPYFLRLGTRLSEILDAAGYPFCPGKIMSSEPRCCRSLSSWRTAFSDWIHALKPDDLLQVKIFFDFRGALDEPELTAALRRSVREEIDREPRFIHLLAHSVLQYEPPLGTFGGFVLEEGTASEATFDVKGVLAQITDFVRMRALQYGIDAAGTLDRLKALEAGGYLRPETVRDTAESYHFLMSVRLRHQAQQVLDRLEPDNRVAPATLDDEERKRLKATLAHVKALQSVLALEFKGA